MPEPLSGVCLDSHGDSATIAHDSPLTLPELCAKIHAKVDAFLKRETKIERLRSVQRQSKLSLNILEESLERYRCVVPDYTKVKREEVLTIFIAA